MRHVLAAASLCLTSSTALAITPEEAQQLLDYHNDLRARLAQGLTTMPASGDSQSLVWDPVLASIAQAHADRCVFQHNSARGTELVALSASASFQLPALTFVGENIGAAIGGTLPSVLTIPPLWEEEEVLYTYGPLQAGTASQVGHYTQMVWSDTRYVGCGTANCPGMFGSPQPTRFVVCDYFPGGNFTGQVPFELAPTATCPPDRPYRIGNVCSGCPDPAFLATGSATPPASCVVDPASCTVDEDCAALDACTDDDASTFAHACVDNACQLTVTDCLTGACSEDTCNVCPDSDADEVCDDVDFCLGDDATGDADSDAVCDDLDVCLGDDAFGDADRSGVCDPRLDVSEAVRGQTITFDVSNARPGAQVFLLGSLQGAGTTCAPGGQICVDLRGVQVLGSAAAGRAGTASFSLLLPAALRKGTTLHLQAVWIDGASGEKTAVETRVVQ